MYSTYSTTKCLELNSLTAVSMLEGERKSNEGIWTPKHSTNKESELSPSKTRSLKKRNFKNSYHPVENTNISCSYIYITGNCQKGNNLSIKCLNRLRQSQDSCGFCGIWNFELGRQIPTLGLWITVVLHVSDAALIGRGCQFSPI